MGIVGHLPGIGPAGAVVANNPLADALRHHLLTQPARELTRGPSPTARSEYDRAQRRRIDACPSAECEPAQRRVEERRVEERRVEDALGLRRYSLLAQPLDPPVSVVGYGYAVA